MPNSPKGVTVTVSGVSQNMEPTTTPPIQGEGMKRCIVGLVTVAAFTMTTATSLEAAGCIDIYEDVVPLFDVDWDTVENEESVTDDECEEALLASEQIDRAYEQNEANGCYNGNVEAAIDDLFLSNSLTISTLMCR